MDLFLEFESSYVGSRFCPTLLAVQTAIQQIRREVRSCAPGRNRYDLRLYHNRYTLYSVWYFAFATGIRGVAHPYLALSEIHPETGFTLLSDKDTERGYKTRVAWIPKVVQQQMRYHQSHTEAIRRLLPATALCHDPCFFLDPALDAIDVRPVTLGEQMESILPLPANFPRRFVRNQLLVSGCPPECVDAWMGHWHGGEEPWGLYSSFSFRRYRQQLQQPLDSLLTRLGFRPMRSSVK